MSSGKILLLMKIKKEMQQLLQNIVGDSLIHAKWLNTLSFMENAGARKISACEHPIHVGIIQLKHAAEEHRHAFYLKKQISKLGKDICLTYENESLLAPFATRQYLNSLDVKACRYLKKVFGLEGNDLKYAAYLFVTYAIEVRADALYPEYQEILTKNDQKVMVKSIILEEEGHLEEMTAQLVAFADDWEFHADQIIILENKLFEIWMQELNAEVAHAMA